MGKQLSDRTTSLIESPPGVGIGGILQEYGWSWQGKPVTAIYEVLGEGQPILLLPAFSSVSTRSELKELAQILANKYQVIALDWIGFGQSARPAIKYSPNLYRAFLRNFVQTMFEQPVVVIAAGHAAGYVMQLAQTQPCPWSWVVLTAPTWRGPLPTAMGEKRWFYRFLQSLIETPILGQFLYLLNISPLFLRLMYGRHVYADRRNITRAVIQQKSRTTHKRNARFASAAFVTGALDPTRNREEWLSWFQPLPVPVLMVIGDNMPPKSRSELEVLAHFSGVQVYRMPGSLGLHEEYPTLLAEGFLPFLDKYLS